MGSKKENGGGFFKKNPHKYGLQRVFFTRILTVDRCNTREQKSISQHSGGLTFPFVIKLRNGARILSKKRIKYSTKIVRVYLIWGKNIALEH